VLKEHRAEVNAVAVSRDERLGASASSDGSARVWYLASGRTVRVFAADEGEPQPLCGVRFLHDGRALLTAGFDGTLKLWSLVTGKFVRDFIGHSGEILDLAVFPDRPHFLSAGEDKAMRLWNAENGQCLWTARDGKARFNALALSPDRRFIFSGGLEGPDSSVRVWEVASGNALTTLCPHKKGVAYVALSPDAQRLLTGSEDNLLRVWDLEWELAGSAIEGVSTLTGQFKAPASSPASSPAIRLAAPRSSSLQPAVNADAPPPGENKRLSVFINLKDKRKE
jgi:WD40 repeat protein